MTCMFLHPVEAEQLRNGWRSAQEVIDILDNDLVPEAVGLHLIQIQRLDPHMFFLFRKNAPKKERNHMEQERFPRGLHGSLRGKLDHPRNPGSANETIGRVVHAVFAKLPGDSMVFASLTTGDVNTEYPLSNWCHTRAICLMLKHLVPFKI